MPTRSEVKTRPGKAHVKRGDELKDKGKFALAARSYEEAIREGYVRHDVHERLGDIRTLQRKHGAATGHYRKGIRMYRKEVLNGKRPIWRSLESQTANRGLYYKLAESLRKQGKYERARQTYLEYIRILEAGDPTTYARLRKVLVRHNDPDIATKTFRTVVRLVPNDPDAREHLADALREKGEHNKANTQYKRAIALLKEGRTV